MYHAKRMYIIVLIIMGMFDWINFKIPCPKCGREISGFQSKDGDCLLRCLEFWQVDNFYSYCEHCEAMIEYTLNEKTKEKIKETIENMRKVFTINDYELNFRERMGSSEMDKETDNTE